MGRSEVTPWRSTAEAVIQGIAHGGEVVPEQLARVFVGGMGAPWVGELFAFRFRGSGLQIGLGKGNSP